MNPIAPAVAAQAAHYQHEFAQAQPFRHVVIDDFLDAGLTQRLLADFPSFEARFALNEMGQVGGKAVREHVRDLAPPYCELDDGIQSRAFLDFVSSGKGFAAMHSGSDTFHEWQAARQRSRPSIAS